MSSACSAGSCPNARATEVGSASGATVTHPATSSSEAEIQASLAELAAGRTTLVIAHRLATIRNADRILVFDAGRVIESGTFDELVDRGGRFAELARAQFMAGDAKPVVAHRPTLALVGSGA